MSCRPFQFEGLPQECEPGIVVAQVEAQQKLPSPQDVVVGRRVAGASPRQARSLSRRERLAHPSCPRPEERNEGRELKCRAPTMPVREEVELLFQN
jgi:hypothetical protein